MIKALNLIKILTRSLYYINDNYTKNKLIAVYINIAIEFFSFYHS